MFPCPQSAREAQWNYACREAVTDENLLCMSLFIKLLQSVQSRTSSLRQITRSVDAISFHFTEVQKESGRNSSMERKISSDIFAYFSAFIE